MGAHLRWVPPLPRRCDVRTIEWVPEYASRLAGTHPYGWVTAPCIWTFLSSLGQRYCRQIVRSTWSPHMKAREWLGLALLGLFSGRCRRSPLAHNRLCFLHGRLDAGGPAAGVRARHPLRLYQRRLGSVLEVRFRGARGCRVSQGCDVGQRRVYRHRTPTTHSASTARSVCRARSSWRSVRRATTRTACAISSKVEIT